MRRSFFNKTGQVYEPNTFIGGVGASTITTQADFAALTDLDESNIKNFQIDANNNVSFYVDALSYVFNVNNTFYNDSNITYLIDVDGLVINYKRNFIRNCPNFKFLHALNLHWYGEGGGLQATNNFPHWRYLRGLAINLEQKHTALDNVTTLEKLYLPNTTNITLQTGGRRQLRNLTSLLRCYIPNAINLTWFYAEAKTFENVNTSCVFYVNPIHQNNSQSNVTVEITGDMTGETVTVNGNTYMGGVDFDTSGNNISQGYNLANAINGDSGTTGSLSSISTGNGILGIWSNLTGSAGDGIPISTSNPTNCVLSNPTLQDGGLEHGLIAWLRDRGCTIVYKTDTTQPDAPTGLSYSNLTSTSVDLNFTPPTPNVNGTGGYEVWIDNGGNIYKHFEYTEITASGDAVDLSEFESGDILLVSIRTFDGQYNLSAFTSPITITLP